MLSQLIVLFTLSLWNQQSLITAQSYRDHPCNRECRVGEPPKTCEYNFTVENYRVLSKACYDCPLNITDCAREECVAADGNLRNLITFNRQMPGPSIEVCDGDRVVVTVTNKLIDTAATSVHWHGQHQKGTPYMDGVGFITQCAIQYKQMYKYDFKVGPSGTHWYHSHVGLQIADGLIGAFIVRQPKSEDPLQAHYDYDLSEHVVIFQDWHPVPMIDRFMEQMHDKFDPSAAISSLINGKNRRFVVNNIDKTAPIQQANTPLSEFYVKPGKRYRFRLIGGGSVCSFQISVDNHLLDIIANDGIPINLTTVDALIIGPGERYDVVLHTDQPVGNYWMRSIGLGDCYGKTSAAAIVRYDTAENIDPPGDSSQDRDGVLFNPIPHPGMKRKAYGYNHSKVITIDEVEYGGKPTNFTDEVVDTKYYTSTFYLNNDNTIFNNKVLYPVKGLPAVKTHLTPVMDNITFSVPPIPPLSQPEDDDESWYCNRSTIVDSDKCLDDLCMCTHRIQFKVGEVVELIVINQGSVSLFADHPMHLHGHSFRILGIEKFDRSLTIDMVKQMDREGRLKRNFINPPLRDTFLLPGASYAVLRFVADNPGIWFFHCHVDGHLVQGKAMLIKIGDVSDYPRRPEGLPRCGEYSYKTKVIINPCPSMATVNDARQATAYIFINLVLIYYASAVYF